MLYLAVKLGKAIKSRLCTLQKMNWIADPDIKIGKQTARLVGGSCHPATEGLQLALFLARDERTERKPATKSQRKEGG